MTKRRVLFTGLVTAAALAVVVYLVRDSASDSPPDTPAASTTSTEPPDTPAASTTSTDPPEPPTTAGRGGCAGATGSSPAIFDEDEGAYVAIITSTAEDQSALAFDVVQWLIGDDAVEAYHQEHPEDPEGPANDYWVIDESDLVRTAPISTQAEVWLVRLHEDGDADVDRSNLADLADYVADLPSLYWLTFDGGTIVEICEQYRP